MRCGASQGVEPPGDHPRRVDGERRHPGEPLAGRRLRVADPQRDVLLATDHLDPALAHGHEHTGLAVDGLDAGGAVHHGAVDDDAVRGLGP